ncbi:hypothetical protein E2C01_024179 [Portunus trituberculatus]|uniref:Uncharacterized protein n=1 Tax=Portunus trituberculatus TaxID=210409 RepID=A0A5B7EBX5_PORTR|nr:hypothetical protein [Portunus trituberculatus]
MYSKSTGSSASMDEQDVGGDEDDKEEQKRPQAQASPVPHSAARSSLNNAKSEKKYRKKGISFLSCMGNCFLKKKPRQVDKATSTTDLKQMVAAPPAPGRHDQRGDTLQQVHDTGWSDLSPPDNITLIQLSMIKQQSPPSHHPPPWEHFPRSDLPQPRDTSRKRKKPPGRIAPRRAHREEQRRRGKSPNRQSSSGKSTRYRKKKSSDWKKSRYRKRSHRERSRGREISLDGPKTLEEEERPGKKEASKEGQESEAAEGRRVQQRKGISAVTCLLWCCLLVAVVVFAVVHSYPCKDTVQWTTVPQETLLVTLVNVALLVIAAGSVLATVKRFVNITSELVVVFILLLLNTSLVKLVRCRSLLYDPSLWLLMLVFPLILIAMFYLCRQVMALALHQPPS